MVKLKKLLLPLGIVDIVNMPVCLTPLSHLELFGFNIYIYIYIYIRHILLIHNGFLPCNYVYRRTYFELARDLLNYIDVIADTLHIIALTLQVA